MDSERGEKIARAFSDVFEKLAFMFAEPAEKAELPDDPGDAVLARMRFSGHWRGTLELAVPADMCPEIAANVLGLEPDDETAETRGPDALKEVLNVTCGSILTTLAGDQPVFDLSVPEVLTLEPEGWKELLDSEESLAFTVDEHAVVLRFRQQ